MFPSNSICRVKARRCFTFFLVIEGIMKEVYRS